MKTATSLAGTRTGVHYKFAHNDETDAPTRSREFADACRRLKRKLHERKFEPSARLVAHVLIDHLNLRTGVISTSKLSIVPPKSSSGKPRWMCWPSVQTLAKETGLSRRSVQVHLKALTTGPDRLFIRHNPPSPGASLHVHRGGKALSTSGCVFEAVEFVEAMRKAVQRSTVEPDDSKPVPTDKKAPGASLGPLWDTYAAVYKTKHGKSPKRLPARDERRIVEAVEDGWRAACPGTPISFDRIVRAYLSIDGWKPHGDDFIGLGQRGLIAKLAGLLEEEESKAVRSASKDKLGGRFVTIGKTAEGDPHAIVAAAQEAIRKASDAVARAQTLPKCLREAVDRCKAAGWDLSPGRQAGEMAKDVIAVRLGDLTWRDVVPAVWFFAIGYANTDHARSNGYDG